MKQLSIFFLALLYTSLGAAQTMPNWLQSDERERNYPSMVFITGFTPGNVRSGETKADAEARLRNDALAYVTEAIRVQVNSEKQKRDTRTKTQTTGKEENEQIQSVFESTVNTSTSLELTGVKTESYADNNGLIYGFAYVNKYELIGYYNAALTMNMQQLESILNTAKQMEMGGEKAKARIQYEETVPLLVKVEQAQDVLIALDRNASPTSLQRDKTAAYRSDIIQALTRLAQGVYICIQSKEDLFGKSSSLIANKVKSVLSKNGCSFTTDALQADFILKLNASARKHGNPDQIVFCYADVEIELVKTQGGKAVYQEELKQKGGHTSYENAAREAFEEVGKTVGDKLAEWVKN
ncbi:MAG: hypothetical protein LBR55_02325 [Bacteroidales bacterium]|jgi:hypothetical protein|nr:hypothetical protein [Bacteroidales bacterium]